MHSRVLTVGAAIVVLGLLWQQAAAQASPERPLIETANGCKLISPFADASPAPRYLVWSGNCEDGLLSGPGTLTAKRTNDAWTGVFKAGEMSHGVLQATAGRYEGDFKDNKPHGRGVTTAENGQVFSSAFTNGASGPGPVKMSWSDGSQYEGEYDHAAQLIEGRGKMAYGDGSVYEGEWRKGMQDGRGVLTLADGEVRTGTWVRNQLTGEATIDYANGAKYRGQVLRNEPHGQGAMKYADGSAYEGEFAAGVFQGAGKRRYANGSSVEGQFRGGEVVGRGRQVLWNGDVYEGEFVASLHDGRGKLVQRDGGFEEGQWKADLLNGECIIKTKNTLYRGACKDGKRSGQGHIEDFRTHLTYDGGFRDHLVHGKGVLQGKDYKYVGDFAGGERQGHGTETSARGNYEGEFAASLWHGKGKLKTVEEGVEISYEGSFAAGQFNGEGVLSFSGVRFAGEFEGGEFVRGKIEGGDRKFEIDVAEATFFEVMPDGSKRSIDAADLSQFGIGS